MKAILLIVILFTNDGNILGKMQAIPDPMLCAQIGQEVVKELNGKSIPSADGGSRLVLDAQYMCLPVQQGRTS